jgi:hypothetical protein
MKFTEARSRFSHLYSRVREGGVEVIERNQGRDVALVNAREYGELLREKAPFRVEVRFGDGYVAMWIKGLPVHAEEPTIGEALDELTSALIDYAATWEKNLRHAPNHAGNRDFVRRVQFAGSQEAIRAMLEQDAAREEVEYSAGEDRNLTPA